MEKKTIHVFGHKYYLLGKDSDGKYVWLQEPTWDCGWYWGGMYLHTFTNNEHPTRSKDIDSHTHFNSVFMKSPVFTKKAFEEYFEETTLTEDEMWILCDYMETYYTLKDAAELFHHGYSWQTSKASIDSLKSEELEAHINKVLLPELFKRIEELLSPAK